MAQTSTNIIPKIIVKTFFIDDVLSSIEVLFKSSIYISAEGFVKSLISVMISANSIPALS